MDPLALFWGDFESYVANNGANTRCFDPSLECSYTTISYETGSESDSDVGKLLLQGSETEILDYVKAPKACDIRFEARVIVGRPENSRPSSLRSPLPFSALVVSQLFKECRFHPNILNYYIQPSIASAYFKGIHSTSILVSNGSWSVSILTSLNTTTGITTTLCCNATGTIAERIAATLKSEFTRPFVVHPAYLPSLIFDIITSNLTVISIDQSNQAGNLLRKLGHWARIDGVDTDIDIESDAEVALTIQESCVNALWRVGECEQLCLALKQTVEAIQHQNSIDGRLSQSFLEIGQGIAAKLDLNIWKCQAIMRELQASLAWSKSVQDWLQVRSAVIANKLSTQIALESKRDSSAMKAIAVLTMVFLPGTFFATLFALPFFSWSATNSTTIVSYRFWIYWVITVPSTVLVLAAWRIWYKLEEWRRENGRGGLFGDLSKSFWPRKEVRDEESSLKKD